MPRTIEAWKKNVRNVPERSTTTKLQSAISPSMNDQWSGKTLRPSSLTKTAMPRALIDVVRRPPR